MGCAVTHKGKFTRLAVLASTQASAYCRDSVVWSKLEQFYSLCDGVRIVWCVVGSTVFYQYVLQLWAGRWVRGANGGRRERQKNECSFNHSRSTEKEKRVRGHRGWGGRKLNRGRLTRNGMFADEYATDGRMLDMPHRAQLV